MDDATVVYEQKNEDATVLANSPKSKPQQKTVTNKKKTKSRSKKKSKLGIEYNAPISLSFSIICLAIFVIEHFLIKDSTQIQNLFSSPTKQGTEFAFVASNPIHYLRLIFYVFGYVDWNQLFSSLILILLLGPSLESNFGGKLVFVMMLISSFVTGVFISCFSPVSFCAPTSIIFMMIILSAYSAIEKKKLPLSLVFVFIFFFSQNLLFSNYENTTVLNCIFSFLGGLLGCLFGFLATPIKKSRKK